ncbi:MAG: hypothetical protein RIE08_06080 [Acidimicrobiales bacterium]
MSGQSPARLIQASVPTVGAALLGVGVSTESFALGLLAGVAEILVGVAYVRLRGWLASTIGATGFIFSAVLGVGWLTYGGAGVGDDPQAGAALGLSVLACAALCVLGVGLAAYLTAQRPFRPSVR